MQLIIKNLLSSLTRKHLRRQLGAHPDLLDTVATHLRNMRGLDAAPASPIPDNFASRALRNADAEAYFHAIARAHRVVIRDHPEPIIKRYQTNGFQVEHDIRNTAEWLTYITGDHDRGVQYWISHYLKKGDIAVDVGANVGIFTLQMARAVTRTGRVLAFEPSPAAARVLQHNLSLNDELDHVDIHNVALGESECEMLLSVPGNNQGAARLVPSGTETEQDIKVPVRNFSRWIKEHGPCSAKVMKIDVEGFELAVLKGMTEYLQGDSPVLLIEITPRGRLKETLEALELIRSLGFGVRQVVDRPPYALPMPASLPKQMDILCTKGIG